MAFRIDADALHRYTESGRITSLPKAQQDAFQAAIDEALDAREDAGGSGEIDPLEERVIVVEKDDNLTEIAEEFDVSLQELQELNRPITAPDPNLIQPGDVILLPNTSPEEAAQSPLNENGVPTGEENFARNLRERGNALEYADDPSAVDYDAEIGELASDIEAYANALPANERQAALQRLYDQDWRDAGPTQMAIEQAAESAGIPLQESGHTGAESETAAREIIAEAKSKSDPSEALAAYQELYDNAPPDVQAALDRSSEAQEIPARVADEILSNIDTTDRIKALEQLGAAYADAPELVKNALDDSEEAQAIIENALDWAAEPLNGDLETVSPMALTRQAMERLETLTQNLDPAFTAEMADRMATRFEEARQHFQDHGFAGPQLGFNGTNALINVLEHAASAEKGETVANRFVEMGLYDMNAIRTAMEQAASNGKDIPAYVSALASLEGVSESFRNEVLAHVDGMGDGEIAGLTEDYSKHLEELSYLISNGSTAMTQEQLEAAIQGYIDEKGPEWQNKLEELEGDLAEYGESLLEEQPRTLELLLEDENAQLAVSMALRNIPELARGQSGQDLVALFNEIGVTGSDNRVAVDLVNAYLRENVMMPAGQIDPSDPASLAEARRQLEETLRDNPELAGVLGINPDQLNSITDAFLELLPAASGDFNAERYGIDMMRNFNNALDKIDGEFRSQPFNRLFRASALAIVGSGLANAMEAYGEDPTLRNRLQLAVESARVGVDGAQFVTSLMANKDSAVTRGLKLGGKMVHLLGAGFAAVNAMTRLSEGDPIGATFNAAAAGGVLYAVFGTSSAAGPIGFTAAGVATLATFAWDGIRNAQHNSRFETDAAANFLRHAGFNDTAASALMDQSGEGYSPVPLLMHYGEMEGLSPEQTVEWINSIAEGEDGAAKLAALRDNLHHTLDEIDGDLSKFKQTAESDRLYIADIEQRPWFAQTGEATPESVAQLEAVLASLEIDKPTA